MDLIKKTKTKHSKYQEEFAKLFENELALEMMTFEAEFDINFVAPTECECLKEKNVIRAEIRAINPNDLKEAMARISELRQNQATFSDLFDVCKKTITDLGFYGMMESILKMKISKKNLAAERRIHLISEKFRDKCMELIF